MNLQRQKMKPIDSKHLTGGLHIVLANNVTFIGLSQIEGEAKNMGSSSLDTGLF
jgi:hypothetical protein